MSRGAWLLGVACVVVVAGGAWLLRELTVDNTAAAPSAAGASSATTTSARSPALAAPVDAAAGSAARYAPFDCTRPSGDAARVDGTAVSLTALCDRLTRIGAVTPQGTDRAQARLALDFMIDATLVKHAIEREHAEVTEDELAAAVRALPVGSLMTDTTVLEEQLRERLALQKLVRLRATHEVTERDVDAEIMSGAPGIDRGQGIRVEGWIARVAPNAGAKAQAASQQLAQDLAKVIKSSPRKAAAIQRRMQPLAPFVVGETGVEPALEKAAFSLSKGRWSSAVQTRVGWAVVRIVGEVAGTPLDDKDLRVRVRRALENRAQQRAQQRLLEELRAAAKIEIVVDV